MSFASIGLLQVTFFRIRILIIVRSIRPVVIWNIAVGIIVTRRIWVASVGRLACRRVRQQVWHRAGSTAGWAGYWVVGVAAWHVVAFLGLFSVSGLARLFSFLGAWFVRVRRDGAVFVWVWHVAIFSSSAFLFCLFTWVTNCQLFCCSVTPGNPRTC